VTTDRRIAKEGFQMGCIVSLLADRAGVIGYGETRDEAVGMYRNQVAGGGRFKPRVEVRELPQAEYETEMAAFRVRQAGWLKSSSNQAA